MAGNPVANRNREFDIDFIRKVYEIVAEIPAGKVATYGQIALMAGDASAAQEVVHIMSRAPSGHKLPCHRVVNRTGSLAPDYAFGGQEKQRMLLEAEVVTFLPNGRIAMERHLWGEYEQLSF